MLWAEWMGAETYANNFYSISFTIVRAIFARNVTHAHRFTKCEWRRCLAYAILLSVCGGHRHPLTAGKLQANILIKTSSAFGNPYPIVWHVQHINFQVTMCLWQFFLLMVVVATIEGSVRHLSIYVCACVCVWPISSASIPNSENVSAFIFHISEGIHSMVHIRISILINDCAISGTRFCFSETENNDCRDKRIRFEHTGHQRRM